jgi:hypothetical protein
MGGIGWKTVIGLANTFSASSMNAPGPLMPSKPKFGWNIRIPILCRTHPLRPPALVAIASNPQLGLRLTSQPPKAEFWNENRSVFEEVVFESHI